MTVQAEDAEMACQENDECQMFDDEGMAKHHDQQQSFRHSFIRVSIGAPNSFGGGKR
jgi:hypothetical protein